MDPSTDWFAYERRHHGMGVDLMQGSEKGIGVRIVRLSHTKKKQENSAVNMAANSAQWKLFKGCKRAIRMTFGPGMIRTCA